MDKMKKKLGLPLAGFSIAMMISGCGMQMPTFESTGTVSTDECSKINKEITEVNDFITKVDGMSAFHLEETAVALPDVGITRSNNKAAMLRDAAKKKNRLLQDRQRGGCPVPKTTDK